MEIDANDVIAVVRQQLSNAQNESALNAAMAISWKKKFDELVTKTTTEKENVSTIPTVG